jgi:predicted TPR repeat methyltransferase
MDRYKITFQTWDKLASLYQDKFMDLDLYNDTYDLFCGHIKKINPKILEIGCGPGNITRYILSKRSDFKIEGIDVSPNMVKLAKENNPSANFKVMDCREIDSLTQKFDAVMCGFCMPYLSKEDCVKLIKDCSSLLNADGIIYFSVIEGDYEQSGYEAGSSGDNSYVYYHQEDFFKKILQENNFELVNLIRKEYPKTAETISTHLIFIAKKK